MTPLDTAKRRIIAATSLEQLISERVQLQSRSGRKVGLCPFHNEKSPSFTVYDDHYFCFGCKAHGDAIDFIRAQSGMGFMETLRFLAQRFGVAVPELDQNTKVAGEREHFGRVYRVLEDAQKIFVEQLATPAGKTTQEYIAARGFTDQNIVDFGFGYAHDHHSFLVQALKQKGHKESDIEAAGLSSRSQDQSRSFDFFRARLMIPIRDPQGRVIAFGGRTMNQHPAKYLNSRDTILFDKSTTLFGYDKARASIRQKSRAVVAEGYLDVFMLWQHGFTESVACLGTALTSGHLRLLAQNASRAFLLFDGDDAGRMATLKAVDHCLGQPGLSVNVSLLPQGSDPDSFLREKGATALEELFSGSEDLLNYAMRQEIKGSHGLALNEIVRTVFVPWLKKVEDPIRRSFLVAKVAHLGGIKASDLESALKQPTQQVVPPQLAEKATDKVIEEASAPVKPWSDLNRLESEFLGHIYYAKDEELEVQKIQEFCQNEWNLVEPWTQFIKSILALKGSPEALPFAEQAVLKQRVLDPEILKCFEQMERLKTAYECQDRAKKIDRIIGMFRQQKLKTSLETLKTQLARASVQGPTGQNETMALLNAIKSIKNEMFSIESNKN